MDWMMELDIMRFFREDKKERRDMDDRYLHDFSSVWRGLPHDDTGLRDGNPSQQYYLQYMKAMKQDNPQQGQYTLDNSGLNCFFDPDTGHLVIQGANGQAVIHKDDLSKLVGAIQGKRPPDTDQPPGNPPNELEAASSNLSPQLKRQMNNNIKALEKWAVASSKSFPK